MLLLIDENVPDAAARFFRDRGHDVRLVRDLFAPGTLDPIIAAAGDELGAIVVTWNRKDFKRLASRVPEGGRAPFCRLGRIVFRCNEARGRSCAEALIEWIEFEFAQVQKLRDRRVMIEIGDSYFRIER